jgi:hypothetical protein
MWGAMKIILVAILAAAPALALADAGPVALGPNGGKFGDWTAATYGSGADKACYAFVSAKVSTPALPKRGQVMLTVTERQGARDEVTISAGYDYPKDAAVTLTVGPHHIDFYTQDQDAFTTSGTEAVSAFRNGDAAVAKSPIGHGKFVVDSFPLAGFSGAFSAIRAACP